ncbi:MAG TPA: ABC transporter ATP-binding protein [Roseiflexaceae bacterium]|nr:ABC transporter ATP-binding protein [Roseiflexaceae bacterium]
MVSRPRFGGPPPSNQPPKPLKERIEDIRLAFGNIPAAFRLVWGADRSSTVLMAALTVVGGFLPLAQAWTAGLIADSVVRSVGERLTPEQGLEAALPFLLLEFGLLLLGALIAQVRRLAEHVLNARLGHHINTEVIRKALALDLHYFEDASFYDKLQNARREADFRALGIINGGFLVVQNLITLLSIGVVLIAFNPWIALLLFGATIPSFVAQNKYSGLHFRMLTWRAPESRRMSYLEHLLTVDASAKEIKLFGLGEPLLRRYTEMFWKIFEEDTNLARRRSWISVGWGLLSSASYYAAYAWVIYEAVRGQISLGQGLVTYLALLRNSQGTFQGLFDNINRLYENGLFMDNLFSFLNLTPQMPVAREPQPMPARFQQGLEFRDVSFRYPDRQDWALRHVNLRIAPGEKLAVVGQNGAGKTTLIKLLTRLYDPTEGQIMLDGVDIRDYDPNELRDRIGVIFQDFVRYQLTARENIGFGQIDRLGDEAHLRESAERGGADEVLSELPGGMDAMLGRWFEKGHELSGGQWQKIALSRAFMRDGEVLVLDEPTSALDAEREYEIFQRFRDLTEGKIAVLISHRFSTVRMADRIIVLEHGQISESGSHAELLAHGGTYARLFEMQAEGYR